MPKEKVSKTPAEQHRCTEKRLLDSEEQFHLLVDAVQDYAVFALDTTGCIATWNVGAQRLKGYSQQEIQGRHFRVFYLPEEVASGKPERELEIAVQEGKYEEEGRRVRKDGTTFWAHVTITPIWAGDGTLRGFAKVTYDRTEQRRREAEARQSEKLSALGSLVTGVAHEINNPLSAISGHAQLLELHNDPQVRADAVSIKELTVRVSRIVHSLLAFTRVPGTVNQKPVSFSAILESTLSMCLSQVLYEGIELEVQVPDHLPLLLADPGQIEQILLNLLTNAVHALRSRTPCAAESTGTAKIVIQANHDVVKDAEAVDIIVRDNGSGIPASILPSIFDPFFTTKDVDEGTGLGLSVSRGIATAHGGKLSVESVVGEGTVFNLRLPCVLTASY
jgi:PAS domain S-box-containing protein